MTGSATCSVRTDGATAHVLVESGGHQVATADVVDGVDAVQLRVSVDHGHLPMQVRRTLLDAVFDLPALQRSRPLQASVPLGDVELLAGLRAHCTTVGTRAAGATCLVDGVIAARP